VKNQQRFNFGGLYPSAYAQAQSGADASRMQTECLIVAGRQTALSVRVRFLHLLSRQIGRLVDSGPRQGTPAIFEPVESTEVAGRSYYAWQEAIEREVPLPRVCPRQLVTEPLRHAFSFPTSRTVELLYDQGETVATVTREQAEVRGSVEITAEELSASLFRVRIAIENLAPSDDGAPMGREHALLRTLTSTHTILSVADGEFVSLLDPPEEFRAAATACQNIGAWPVLVGAEGERDTMLASPIILYDYPQIAPESAGDMFDGTEIDEILTLRIMLLTDAEKREMCDVDERARQILERTETMPPEQLWKMHGAVRGLRPAGEATP
jgi:hydrogenase maturation protease